MIWTISIILYLLYCVAVSVVLVIVWGIMRLVRKDFSIKKWHWIVCGIIYILPLLYAAVHDVYLNYFYDRTGFIEERMEWATKVDFPEFEIAEYRQGETCFNGDYTDEYELSFKEVPSQEFYDRIEALCGRKDATGTACWSKVDSTHYQFNHIWGMDFPNPDGKITDEEASLSVSIEKGSMTFTVTEGRW